MVGGEGVEAAAEVIAGAAQTVEKDHDLVPVAQAAHRQWTGS